MASPHAIERLSQLLDAVQSELKNLKQQEPSPKKAPDSISLASFFTLSATQHYQEVLDTMLRCAMRVVGAGGAGLTLFDPKKMRLVFTAAIGDGSEGILGYEIPLEGSQHGLAFATGEVQASTPLDSGATKASGTVFRNVLVAPLLVDDDPIGTISAVNKQDGSNFSPKDMEAYALFADLAAIVVRQGQSSEQLQQQLETGESNDQNLAGIELSSSEKDLFAAIQMLGKIQSQNPGRLPQVTQLLKTFLT